MGVGLNWGSDGPEGPGSIGDPAPCVICKVPTILRSPKGKPCHKVCAERWLDRQAEAKRQQDQARSLQRSLTDQAEDEQVRQRTRSEEVERERLLDQEARLERAARARHEDIDNTLTLTLE